MTINYTTLLGLAQPVPGTEANTWGTIVNESLTALLDSAIAGSTTFSVTSGNVTLSDNDGAADQARSAILIPTGTPGVSRDITAPSRSKAYIVLNQSNAPVVIKGAATTGATVTAGTSAIVAWNGVDFVLVGLLGQTDSATPFETSFGFEAGKVSTGANNSFFGYQSGKANTTGASNETHGYQALYSNTSGHSNSAVGTQSLYSNTTGEGNVAMGISTLNSNTTGDYNTAIGWVSLLTNTTGTQNVAVGFLTASDNTTGINNTALGAQAGGISTGSNNTVIGRAALASSLSVNNEITIGNSSNTVIRYPHNYSTVASLPLATIGRGSRTFVTDASSPTFGSTVAGGGAIFISVFSNGTNWIVG